jgi:TonB family protein
MRLIAAACLALALAAPVAAQGLPSSVSEPYRAYQAAMEAGDEAAALEPAYRAWQAAEDASVDAETTGLLADNYAALASAAGQHVQAAAAFARSAEILADTEGNTVLTAQTWRLAAREYYQAEETTAAERMSDRALALLGRLPAGDDVSAERFQANVLLAYIAFENARIQQAGNRAEDALDALRDLGPVSNTDSANMAFFAGLEEVMDGNFERATYFLSLASAMFTAANGDERTLRTVNAWVQYTSDNLREGQNERIRQRLDESGYSFGGCLADVTCGMGSTLHTQFPDVTDLVDAVRTRTVTPDYPDDLENAGLEGVALITFSVSEEGEVVDAEILYSVPHSAFGAASLEAVERWEYDPLLVDGVPTRRDNVVSQFIFQF